MVAFADGAEGGIMSRISDRSRLVMAPAGVLAVAFALCLPIAANAAPPPHTVSTVAGGVGGPARATAVALAPRQVAFGSGKLEVVDSESFAVRRVAAPSDQLTTPLGDGLQGLGAGPAGGTAGAKARLQNPAGISVDASGNVAFDDRNAVYVLAGTTGHFFGRAMTAGHVYRVAGTGIAGFSGDGGPATSAKLSSPNGVGFDHSGNLVVGDAANDRIRLVAQHTGSFYGRSMTANHIYTIAGNGNFGCFGDGGPATSALLRADDTSEQFAADSHGNLLFDDGGNHSVRVVAGATGTFFGQSMTKGNIYTLAGTCIQGFTGDGGPATNAELASPQGLALDGHGNVVIGDTLNNRIRVVAEATATFYDKHMTAHDIYTVAGTGTAGFGGDGGVASAAKLNGPTGVAVDSAGTVLVADAFNRRVRAVATKTGKDFARAMTANHIVTVAGNGNTKFSGDGGAAAHGQLQFPDGALVDASGNLLVADATNERIRIVAARTGTFYGRSLKAGDIFTLAGKGSDTYSGEGGPASAASVALFNPFNGVGAITYYMDGMSLDDSGNVVIPVPDANRVVVVPPHSGHFYGKAMTAGHIYTIAGTGALGSAGDGGPATQATLDRPVATAVDASGNVLFTEGNTDVFGPSTSIDAVRVVAEKTGTFYGRAMHAGDVYTIAGRNCPSSGALGDGGPAMSACFFRIGGVALDHAGNVVIGDGGNNRIRVVAAKTGTFWGVAMHAGHVYTVAGDGTGDENASPNGTLARHASVIPGTPAAVSVDATGNIVIADHALVRVVAVKAGTFDHVAMQPNRIYTVAGDGDFAFGGDGGPPLSASFLGPAGVAIDGPDLFVVDAAANRVREVRP